MDFDTLSNLPAWLLLALVLGVIALDVYSDIRRLISGYNVVLIGIIAWYLLEAIQMPRAVREFGQDAYNLGIFCVAMAAASFLIGYGTRGCSVFPHFGRRVELLDDPHLLWQLIVICSVIGFAPIAYYSGLQVYDLFVGIMGMRDEWGGLIGRARYGGFRDAMLMLEMFVTGIGPFAAMLALDRRLSRGKRAICAAVAVWPVLRGYGSGTRSSMITTILPVLAIVYWRARPLVQRGIVIAALACVPLLFTVAAAIVESRNSGHLEMAAAERADYVGHEMFRELLFIQEGFPDRADYLLGDTYYVQLVNPIPRFLWEGKPRGDAGLVMAHLHGAVARNGEPYMTVSPGLIGEMYMNFGLIGVALLSAFGGWAVRGWDRMARCYPHSMPVLILYSVGLATLFIMGRSFTMNMFYGILAFAGAVYVIRPQSSSARLCLSD